MHARSLACFEDCVIHASEKAVYFVIPRI